MAADPVLLVIFLRGGADGLNLVAPTGDSDYAEARPEGLRVMPGDGRSLGNPLADVGFRWHPAATDLADLFDAGELAVVHACGLDNGTRSHFDAEARIESAADAALGAGRGGWLGRWLDAARPEGLLPTLALGAMPDSLRGARDVAVAGALEDLVIGAGPEVDPLLFRRLDGGFGLHPLMAAPARRLMTLSGALAARILDPATGERRPYAGRAHYPDTELGAALATVAEAVRLDLGLRVATVDYGGWDTHAGQAEQFGDLVQGLGAAIAAFRRDLDRVQGRITVVVMSEFGRRLRANATGGTDHGHGNAMLVWGAGVRGGRMFGRWPGLASVALDDGADLAVTTDYRQVLAEILAGPLGAGDLSVPFPGFTPEPLGLTS
jgi:uncharacterized protein (DUF1501 family)